MSPTILQQVRQGDLSKLLVKTATDGNNKSSMNHIVAGGGGLYKEGLTLSLDLGLGLQDHDGTYLIPKSVLQSLARSSPLQIEGVDMIGPQQDHPAAKPRGAQSHSPSQPVSSNPGG